MPGVFISFEGVDGCGKTTQMSLFCDWLAEHNIDFVRTREPGGTDVGKSIRKLVLEGDGDKFDGVSELFLFSADRHEHIRQLIKPALAEGKWVVSDRFADSTTVFQSVARGVPREQVEQIHQLAVGDCWPELTIILDIPFEEGLKRKKAQEADGLTETRMESLGPDFHRKIREGYHQVAQENPERCKLIDAMGSMEEVHARIIHALRTNLKQVA